MNIKPLGKQILLTVIEKEQTSKSGILLSGSEKQAPEQGVVTAVGPEVSTVVVGQTVIFKKYVPEKVMIGDVSCLFAQEEDVLAIIEE